MPAAMQLLALEPENQLHFCKTPMTASPNRMLKLTNNSDKNVAFKVKTTAPKSYLVRPSSGTLRKGESQEVQIILQPQGTDGQANNHRFLVQAVATTSPEPVTREQWSEFAKEAVQEQRLNVVLEERETEQAVRKVDESSYGPSTTEVGRGSTNEAPPDLKVKYDELVQYTLQLEKDKKKLEAELGTLQGAKGAQAGAAAGYSTIHMIIVALIAFLLSYAAKFLG